MVWLIAGLIGVDFVRKIRSVTATELLHGQQRHSFAAWTIALHRATSGQVRWETGTIASMLLDCTVTLQPTSADDQVAHSELLEQIQTGMWRWSMCRGTAAMSRGL